MGDGAQIFSSFAGAFIIFVIVAVAVMIALRVMLPFSIFKIKELSEESLDEQKKTNELLGLLIREVRTGNKREETSDGERTDGPFD